MTGDVVGWGRELPTTTGGGGARAARAACAACAALSLKFFNIIYQCYLYDKKHNIYSIFTAK